MEKSNNKNTNIEYKQLNITECIKYIDKKEVKMDSNNEQKSKISTNKNVEIK
jgi:hypothetical protein